MRRRPTPIPIPEGQDVRGEATSSNLGDPRASYSLSYQGLSTRT